MVRRLNSGLQKISTSKYFENINLYGDSGPKIPEKSLSNAEKVLSRPFHDKVKAYALNSPESTLWAIIHGHKDAKSL